MKLLGALFVVAACWLLGKALLPSRRSLARDLWEESCAAFAIGAAGLVAVSMTLGWLGVPLGRMVSLALLAAAAAAGVLRIRNETANGETLAPSVLLPWQKGLIAALAVGSALVLLSTPLSNFDALFHFAYKGKLLWATGDVLDPGFTGMVDAQDRALRYGRVMTHPDYPIGVPFLMAHAAHAGFGWSERWVQLPLAFWAACIPGLVALGLRGGSGSAARWGALIAAATPILYVRGFLSPGSGGISPMLGVVDSATLQTPGDPALAAMLTASCALVLCAVRERSRCLALLAGLTLAGGAQMKNEGLALSAIFLLALAISRPLGGKAHWRTVGLVAAAFLLATTPWLIHRTALPTIDENYGALLTPANVLDKLDAPLAFEASAAMEVRADVSLRRTAPHRGATAVDLLEEEILPWKGWRNWGLLWPAAMLAMIFGGLHRNPTARFLAL
ncbi:MAG TPA: hypothetical protein VGC54_07680, partial [Planctomycetota bacterium]